MAVVAVKVSSKAGNAIGGRNINPKLRFKFRTKRLQDGSRWAALNFITNLGRKIIPKKSLHQKFQLFSIILMYLIILYALSIFEAKYQLNNWIWQNWYNSHLRHHRSAIRFQSSANFIYCQLYWKDGNKEKGAGNGSSKNKSTKRIKFKRQKFADFRASRFSLVFDPARSWRRSRWTLARTRGRRTTTTSAACQTSFAFLRPSTFQTRQDQSSTHRWRTRLFRRKSQTIKTWVSLASFIRTSK